MKRTYYSYPFFNNSVELYISNKIEVWLDIILVTFSCLRALLSVCLKLTICNEASVRVYYQLDRHYFLRVGFELEKHMLFFYNYYYPIIKPV